MVVNKSSLDELLDKGLIDTRQHQRLEPILSGRILSVFVELRLALYLGVLLFTTGIGILIYLNIGDIGHLVTIACLILMTLVCLGYAFYESPPYSNLRHPIPTPYFDYVVLLGCLLLISVLGYLQFQYELFDESMGITTLISAMLFFFMAYRFDHLGVLSLGITALASFLGITLTPQRWYEVDWFDASHLSLIAMALGVGLGVAAVLLNWKKVKSHFTFTYLNFASLLFLVGALSKVLEAHDYYPLYLLLLLGACAGLIVYGMKTRSFLFLLYAYVAGWIGLTAFLGDTLFQNEPSLWFLYFILSCGGVIVLIIRYRSFFKRTV